MARTVARPSLVIACPKSTSTWRTGTRARAGGRGELTATCPSCGMGLVVRETRGRLELVPGRNAKPAQAHRLEVGSTFGGLR